MKYTSLLLDTNKIVHVPRYKALFKRCIDGNPACVSDGVIVKTASAQLQVVLAEETVTDALLKVLSEMTQYENIHRLPQTFAQLVGKIL